MFRLRFEMLESRENPSGPDLLDPTAPIGPTTPPATEPVVTQPPSTPPTTPPSNVPPTEPIGPTNP